MRIGRPCCLMALVLAAAILARLALRGPDNDRVSAPHDEPHATGDTRPAAVAVTRSSGEQGCAPCDGAATHAPSERRTCVFGSEVFGDVSYDCSSNFDPLFYRRLHSESALAFLDDSALERHYSDFGVLAGHRGHSGQRTMKIILMTRDDWPLIRSWVLYHADVFGGENLYVLDGSSDERQLRFMRDATRLLGVHHFRTHANLNWIGSQIQAIAMNLTSSCDFITKMDTDEFIVTTAHDDAFSDASVHFEAGRVRNVLDALPIDGARYTFSFYANSFPDDECSLDWDSALSIRYERPWRTTLKTLLVSRALAGIDLGNHVGQVRDPPFNQSVLHPMDLGIAHHHFRCFSQFFKNTEKAMISLSYFVAEDTLEVKIDKLSKLDPSRINSGHKVIEFLQILKEGPEAAKARYNHRKFWPGHPDTRIFTGVRDRVLQLLEDWRVAAGTD